MAYTVSLSNRFKKDFHRCIKRGLNMKHITDAMDLLEATGTLPAQYRPHKLSGNRKGQWECHIARLADDVGAKRHSVDTPFPADRHTCRLVLTPPHTHYPPRFSDTESLGGFAFSTLLAMANKAEFISFPQQGKGYGLANVVRVIDKVALLAKNGQEGTSLFYRH